MARVRGPLLSVAAWGRVGNMLVFQRRRSGATVYPYVVPVEPNTEAQLAQQASFASAVSSWYALPGTSMAWWTEAARGLALTGRTLYIQNYLLGKV